MESHLHRNWVILGLRALAASQFVILTIAIPLSSFARLTTLLAAYWAVDGVLSLIAAIRQTPPAECLVFAGLISVISGALLLILPTVPPTKAVMAISAWGVTTGLLTIPGALSMEMSRGRSVLSIAGAVSVLLGVPLAFTAPGDPVMVEWLPTLGGKWLGEAINPYRPKL